MLKSICENEKLIIALSGHIDSSNAPQTEREIGELCAARLQIGTFVLQR